MMFRNNALVPADQFFNRLHDLGWVALYTSPGNKLIGYIPPSGKEAVPVQELFAIPKQTQLTLSARFWMWVWSWA